MDRRKFIAAAISVLIGTSAPVRAQSKGKTRRIGLLMVEQFSTDQRADIRAVLRERGWIEGKNLIVESRSADGDPARLRPLADELVKLDVELIVGAGTVASQAAKSATARIPIVIYRSGDPVGAGLVETLARPGGNVTGTSTMSTDLDVKRLQVLRELLPGIARIGELVNPTNPAFAAAREAQERACRSLGLHPIFVEVTAATQLDAAVAEVVRRGGQALLVSADPLFGVASNRRTIMGAVRRLKLPTMVEGGLTDENEGGLVSLWPDDEEMDRQFADVVDRILKGANPGTVPIEQPTRFRLSVDLRTAKALGITVPQSLLLRADEVIQ